MNITRGKKPGAKKIVLYGTEGIGKSTFASKFPDPLFIDTEDSTRDMNVARFDKPTSWEMLLQEVQYVINHPDCCKTLVLDTADWAEQLEIADLCAKKQWSGLEDPGYGKGYQYSAEEFGRLLNLLSNVIEKGVHIVITAHAWLRKIDLPDELGSYDHWEMKTSKKVAPMIREWADAVFFANYKTLVVNVDGQGASKGKNKAQGGKRVIYTTHHPCWDAKNRYGLPDEIPMDYNEIRHVIEDQAVKADQAPPKDKKSSTTPPVKQRAPEPAEPDKSHQEPAKEEKATQPMDQKQEPINPPDPKVDERIPKALRDLMIANGVDEWDIQNVVAARGYFPADMVVADYPADFVSGVLVGAWPQVHAMIKEMKEKDSLVFN